MLMCMKVLAGLQQKAFLLPETVVEIETELKQRDALPSHIGFSSPPDDASSAPKAQVPSPSATPRNGRVSSAGAPKALDKKQIEQRIEEDRERHKRLREHQWAVPLPDGKPGDDDDIEFEKMWDETSSLNSDDYQAMEEEAEQREQCAREHSEEMAALGAE